MLRQATHAQLENNASAGDAIGRAQFVNANKVTATMIVIGTVMVGAIVQNKALIRPGKIGMIVGPMAEQQLRGARSSEHD